MEEDRKANQHRSEDNGAGAAPAPRTPPPPPPPPPGRAHPPPGAAADGPEALRGYVGAATIPMFHPVGTAKMGAAQRAVGADDPARQPRS